MGPARFQVLPHQWFPGPAPSPGSSGSATPPGYEQLPASHEAMITCAIMALMTRRLTQPGG